MKCSKFLANSILLVNYSAAQLPCQPHFQAPERNKDLLDVCTYCTTKHFQLMLICELGHFHCSPSGQCLSPVSVAWHDVKYFYPPLHTHRNGGPLQSCPQHGERCCTVRVLSLTRKHNTMAAARFQVWTQMVKLKSILVH